MPTLTNAQGALVTNCSPFDTLNITVSSGAYSLEYPIGTVIASAVTTSATYRLGAGQFRLTTTGSVDYFVNALADANANASVVPTGVGAPAGRSISPHNLQLAEPLVQLDLPSPYQNSFTGLTNKEHAYGTPGKHFPLGWNGYKFWMIGAPYPTTVKGTCTMTIASPAVISYTGHPFTVGMPVTFSTTGALPTGITAGLVYWVISSGFGANSFQVSSTPGGSAVNTSGTQSGVHTVSLYSAKYENPTLYVSNDGENFIPAPGAPAPLFDTFSITSGSDLGSYYADPYLVFDDATGKMYVLWCWFGRTGTVKSSLLLSESTDGVNWTPPVEIHQSTSTTFTPNSPSLIRTSTGWTMVAIDTRDATGTFAIIVSRTTSSTPYSGWTAPSTVYSGIWSQSTATHPLTRNWWHMFAVSMADGEIAAFAADNNSAGGAAYSLYSADGGLTFSVQPFSAWNSASAGGSWYRPGLCVCNDGTTPTLLMYVSRVSGAQNGAAGGFYMQKARLTNDKAQDAIQRAVLRDMVHRQIASPTNLITGGLLAWDSFNRADAPSSLGNADSGQTWTANLGTWGTLSNQAYVSAAANSIATIDVLSQSYDYELRIATVSTSYYLVWNHVDNNNFWRFGYTGTAINLQCVQSGSIVTAKTWGANLTIASGDILRISKRGPRVTLWLNDRPIDSFTDTTHYTSTKVGMQTDNTTTRFDNFIVRVA